MSDIDQHGRLEEAPFAYRATKEGKLVKTLKGKHAEKLCAKLEGANDFDVQLILAKGTGNFKRGNERESEKC